MGRVAVDFGVGQGAKRSADIRSDLGPASNAGQRQNQRNRRRREAEGQLAASLGRYSPLWGCASLAPCHPPFCLYARPTPVFQQSPSALAPLRETYRLPCMKTYLSKSDFKVARTCATKLYYKKLRYPSIRDDDQYLQFLADGGYMVEAIARLCHPGGIEIGFEGGPEPSAAQTLSILNAHETVTLFEATLLWENRLARVDILEKSGNSLRLIEVKAKSVDTSTGENPFRGVRGNISSNWQPYLEDVAFQYSVLRNLFPEVKITPYLCLVDKSKTTSIHSLFSKFQLSTSNLEEARFRRPTVAYTGDADELRSIIF